MTTPTNDYQGAEYLYAIHDPGGEHLIVEAGKTGYVVFTEDVQQSQAGDYRAYRDQGIIPIVRLNWGYGSTGTIPRPDQYDAYAAACKRFVSSSKGAFIWIIGNETNHRNEWPDGKPIYPQEYARCYIKARDAIKSFDPRFKVGPAPTAPYDNTLKYPGNENGDWVTHFRHILEEIVKINKYAVDFIPMHAYTHGSDPSLITSEAKMGPPFQNRHYNFLVYREFLWVVPRALKSVPVFITETDQIDPWDDRNTGWVKRMYEEIYAWNMIFGVQQIYAVALYRWPNIDQWGWETKEGVKTDFREAVARGYKAPGRPWDSKDIGQLEPVESKPEQFNPPPRPTPSDDIWERAYPYVLSFEGGYTDDPRDKGNWTKPDYKGELKGTKYGISALSYPHLDIRNLTKAQALDIYKQNYWVGSGSDKLPWPLALVHFDTAINAGNGRAKSLLAKSQNNAYKYLAERLAWYTTLDDWHIWSAGWSRRIAKLLEIIS